jgi:4,5-dihydroxyphthalate decarboxylase
MKNYDHLAPIASGDVVVEDVDLTLDRESPIARIVDPQISGGEMSFSKYLIRLSQGVKDYVGLPVFPVRGFQHRCFFVRRGSNLRSFDDLVGKRVGTNGWPETGVTLCRGALREAGVGLDKVNWFIGPLGLSRYDVHGPRPEFTLPPNAREVDEGRGLVEMLLNGDLDALMVPTPPPGFYDPDSPIVRLYPDYPEHERAFLQRVGFHPAHHLVVLKRDVFEANPSAARSLYRVLEESKRRWQAGRLEWAETSPWLLADIEQAQALIGEDWMPYGVEANRRMIEWMCNEEYAQGLSPRHLDPAEVFAEFEQVMNA